jgi:hypothetical protein
MLEPLKILLGRWEGEGVAIYPTIAETPYREVLIFTLDEPHDALQYEQKTWRAADGRLLAWEFGFVHLLEDGSVRVNNSQNNGRVEVMEGALTPHAGGFALTLLTMLFGNDPRMVEARREWRVDGAVLTTRHEMATQTVREMHTHLEATLCRR